MENTHVMMNYFRLGEHKIPFVDVNFTFFDLLGTQEYVVVPGYGRTEDYEGLDVEGKIAVISRGTTSFPEKQATAQAHGAIGAIMLCLLKNAGAGEIAVIEYNEERRKLQAGEDMLKKLQERREALNE